MKSSIVRIENDNIIVVRKSFIDITGDKNAGILLSYFVYWNDIKIAQTSKNIHLNDVAEKHGDERTQDETLLQYHTNEEIFQQCFGVLSRKAIPIARKVLNDLGFISEHKNPNPKYKFDKTIFFRVYSYRINTALRKFSDQQANGVLPEEYTGFVDNAEEGTSSWSNTPDRYTRKGGTVIPNLPNGIPKKTRPITMTTTKTTTENNIKTYVDTHGSVSRQYNFMMEQWNAKAREYGLATIRSIPSSRKLKIKKRLKERPFNFTAILDSINESTPLLIGKVNQWKVTFDWLIKNDTNYIKVIEGNYTKKNNNEPIAGNGFMGKDETSPTNSGFFGES